MFKALTYYWTAARGYRLKPWKSPYMRWRFETFLGKEATDMTAGKFFQLAWKYREHMERFVDWAAERRRFQRDRKSTRLNSSHSQISYAVFCLKKKKT